jgi:hypothetical protein
MLPSETKRRVQERIAALPASLRSQPASEAQLLEFEENFGSIPEDYR